jgi:hypothetical protein
MRAKSGCELPRDRRQIYNAKKAHKACAEGASVPDYKHDTLAQVMQMCKETSSSTNAFVRSVEAAPEPMCVLATDQQLCDLARFCLGNPSSVLSIDPTFNLGPFYVTPITYHNLLVKTKNVNHPIMLGPVLIHQTKMFRPFHYFASTLIRLNSKLVDLKAFGTDGEPELIKAFSVCFPNAAHLRCMNLYSPTALHRIPHSNSSGMHIAASCSCFPCCCYLHSSTSNLHCYCSPAYQLSDGRVSTATYKHLLSCVKC